VTPDNSGVVLLYPPTSPPVEIALGAPCLRDHPLIKQAVESGEYDWESIFFSAKWDYTQSIILRIAFACENEGASLPSCSDFDTLAKPDRAFAVTALLRRLIQI
jgi:hypothetical protein